jgi:hypothetical protein
MCENRYSLDRYSRNFPAQNWSTVGLFKAKKQADNPAGGDNVFYSTPFGDTNDGEQKLFLLERNGVSYFPVFRSVDSMKKFYHRMNRAAYMIINGDIQAVMNSLSSIELLKNTGIVIEPFSEYPVEIPPSR